jgi:hypothetical protein
MSVATGDTCNVASHLSSLYLYVTFRHFHCWFLINRYATSLPVRMLCRRKSLFVFLTGINIYVFRNLILLSTGPTWIRAVPRVRVNDVTYEPMPALRRVCSTASWPNNSIPFLCYCSCLRGAYIAGVGKYGPRGPWDACGPWNIRVLP